MVLEIFNTGLTALNANQVALDITAHNIANVNTPGYTRQRAELITNYPQNAPVGQLGTGVLVEQINRLNDAFTHLQLQIESRDLGENSVKREVLQQLENIYNEPTENGLANTLNDFFSAWQTLADAPEDYGARSVVAEKSKTLVSLINSMSRQLGSISNQVDDTIELKVERINEITAEIAQLNDEISKVEVGGVQNANDLRDTRDNLLLELNTIIDVEVRETDSNVILVEARGGVLVAGVRNVELDVGSDANGHTIPVVKQSGDIIFPQSGELKGYIDVRDEILNDAVDNLNTLSLELIENVNRIHSRGAPLTAFTSVTSENGLVSSGTALSSLDWDFEPTTGSFTIAVYDSDRLFSEQLVISVNPGTDTLEDIRDRINSESLSGSGAITASVSSDNKLTIASSGGTSFNFVNHTDDSGDSSDFLLTMGMNTFFTGNSAATIDVASTIQSDLSLISAAKSNSPGDNRTALDIASLQNSLVLNNDQSTFNDFLRTQVSSIGNQTVEALRNEERLESVISLLEERMAQTTGVSLDEEATNILKYQRAYQAAAKLVTTANSLFDTLLSM